MASYKKGERVKITAPLSLKSMDSFLTKEKDEFYLHIGEVFECIDHSQPDFMEYLNVFCHKRRVDFELPMEFVKRLE